MGANKSPNSSYAKVIKGIKLNSFRTQRETPATKVAPPRDSPISVVPESAPHRESPFAKAPEKTVPTSPSRPKGAIHKTRKNEAKDRQSSKGTSGNEIPVPEKGTTKKTNPSQNIEDNQSKKPCRNDRDTVEGFVPVKRTRSYRSSEDESEMLEISNPFAVLDSNEGQAKSDKKLERPSKHQRTRSMENLPSTQQQLEAQTSKVASHESRRSSFSKPSLPPAHRVKKLDFNNFQQGESQQKAHAAGNK